MSLSLSLSLLISPHPHLRLSNICQRGFRAQYNRIRDPEAKEASQREVVMVYILFHPVILVNDKDGSSNKSHCRRRRRRTLDTERTGREE